jgi:hypothetical protein
MLKELRIEETSDHLEQNFELEKYTRSNNEDDHLVEQMQSSIIPMFSLFSIVKKIMFYI